MVLSNLSGMHLFKRSLIAMFALSAIAFSPAEAETEAEALLTAVKARMPRQPILISGTLNRKGRDRALGATSVEALLDFSRKPMAAQYTVRSESSDIVEQMAVFRKQNGQTSYKYSVGKIAAEPKLSANIQNSDITWLDLTLSFLWWKAGSIEGEGTTKGRDCHIINVTAPAQDQVAGRTVKLWIDKKHLMMLRAEEYDSDGKALRRVSVKSFKKIDDQWMIKDLEVRDLANGTRTILRIDEVTPLSQGQ